MDTHDTAATPVATREVPRLLTVNELAAKLGIARWTVYRLVRDGELRAVRAGERYRFRPEDVNTYLERDLGPA